MHRGASGGVLVSAVQTWLAWVDLPVSVEERSSRTHGPSTRSALERFQAGCGLPVTGEIDAATEAALRGALTRIAALPSFDVRGRVLRRDGSPWADARVDLYDLDLRTFQKLGSAVTDAEGRYCVAYGRERYRDLEAGGPDLIARISRDGERDLDRTAILDPARARAHAGPVFNAAAEAKIDLVEDNVTSPGDSLWERTSRAIDPLLGSVRFDQLDDADREFIVNDTALAADLVARYVRARAEATSSIAPEAWFALLASSSTPTTSTAAAALADAITNAIIPARPTAWIDAVVAALGARDRTAWEADGRGPAKLAQIAMGDDALGAAFAARLAAHTGSLADLWTSLGGDSTFAQHVPTLRRTFQVAPLVGFHAPMVGALLARVGTSDPADALPEITDADWDALVAANGHPDDVTASAYANAIRSSVETAYRSRYVAARIDRLDLDHASDVATFLRSQPLELLGAPLDKLVNASPTPLASPDVLVQVARLQRVYRAVGNLADAAVVMKRPSEGAPAIGSAGDIARLGRSGVRKRFAGDDARADRVFDSATAAHHDAIAYWSKLRPEIDRPLGVDILPPVAKVGGVSLAPMEVDFCSCASCRSVLSPAAYLVDLLALLDSNHAPDGEPLKTYLYRVGGRTQRRSDIGKIHLDCPNTTTILPYIDLVIELLEWCATRPEGLGVPLEYQTTRTTEELLIAPEHVIASAYDTILPRAFYPWSLPFSLPNRLADVYLQPFGVTRPGLAELLGAPPISLELTTTDRELLTGTATTQPWALWHLQENGNSVVDPITGDQIALPWLQVLAYGKLLRLASGLDQETILAILGGRYLARFATVTLGWSPTECDLDRAPLVGFTVAAANAFHVHARLAAKLGWTVELVDVALERLAPTGAVDDHALHAIASVRRLATRLGLSQVEAIAMVATMPTRPHAPDQPSLYASLFLDGRSNPNHQAAFALDAHADAFASTPTAATVPMTVVAAIVGLTSDELTALIASTIVDSTLDLDGLSSIYRAAKLLRASGLAVADFVALVRLSSEPPLPITDANADRLLAFLDVVTTVRATGLSVGELAILCRGASPSAQDATFLPALRRALVATVVAEGWPVASGAADGGAETRSRAAQARASIRALAAELGIGELSCEVLVGLWPSNPFVITAIDAGEVAGTPIVPSAWADDLGSLRARAEIVQALRLDDADLALVVAGGWLDFTRLSTVPSDQNAAATTFGQIITLARMAQLRSRVPVATVSLWQALHAGAVATWAGLDATVVSALAKAIAPTATLAATVANPIVLGQILDAAAVIRKLGVSVDDALAFVGTDLTMAIASQIRDAARAAQPLGQWDAIAKPLQDRLRTAQRDALAAYVGAKLGLDDRGLIDRLLIDVDMSDCQLTSRIQQAICSVQMFIQRVTMHLEVDASDDVLELGDDARAAWKTWMSSYATWAQARSIFLYPESVLDPALRPDKSEQFLALERKLDQADVTTEVGRDALLEYLEQLDILAALDPRAVYRQSLEELTSSLFEDRPIHVIARTRETPHTYYYRAFAGGDWGAWEKVDLDLTDHVTMAMFDGRLFAYWVDFQRKGSTDTDDQNKDPYSRSLEATLSWSERKRSGWTPARTARQTAIVPRVWDHQLEKPNLDRYTLRTCGGDQVGQVFAPGAIPTSTEPGDVWVLVTDANTVKSAPDYKTLSAYSPVVYGWFHVTGCNGAVEAGQLSLDVDTIHFAFGGTVGPLVIEDSAWRETGALYLDDSSTKILDKPASRRVVHGTSMVANDAPFQLPMIVDDARRAYVVVGTNAADALAIDPAVGDPASLLKLPSWWSTVSDDAAYRFVPFTHGFTCDLISRLNHGQDDESAITALLSPASQTLAPAQPPLAAQLPHLVEKPYPAEALDLVLGTPYGGYNWELFFYLPLLIVDRLRTNQRFAEALTWLQRIYDPTSHDAVADPMNGWQFLPLRQRDELMIQEVLALLDETDPKYARARELVVQQLDAWRRDPLDPHAVARYRPGAWMRAVKLRYVDLLIAWGDALFRQETIESLNQATLRYLLALDVMGAPPIDHPDRATVTDLDYDDLSTKPLDEFSNALVAVENWVPPSSPRPPGRVPVPAGMTFYFCIPRNDKIDVYWQTIADRLYNVRHCLDLEGRPLDLLPFGLRGQLAQAQALGNSMDRVTIPNYRFTYMIAKALELANDVQRFGASLLAALEKQDGEALALLRSSHDRSIAVSLRESKLRQVDEAKVQLVALQRGRDAIQSRYEYYASRSFMNAGESTHLALTVATLPLLDAAGGLEQVSGILALIPTLSLGMEDFTTAGGWGQAAEAVARALRMVIANLQSQAALALTVGGYSRRSDEWGLQKELAKIELDQNQQQLDAAQLRIEIAQQELATQELQIQHADEITAFLTSKFTSQELYGWMVDRLGTLYFQMYELAYALAKRTEVTYQYERAEATSFVQPLYFDKLRQGLLAGEALSVDLRRMETSYLERNAREFEITKHISLVEEFPEKAVELFAKGSTTFDVDETLFDRDFRGHWMRRIKTIAMSVPCVGGAYATVAAKLTVSKSKLRANPDPSHGAGAPALVDSPQQVPQSFVISTGQRDSGMFEPNLRDERYLPCEGMGAVATYQISMSLHQADIDPRQVTDVVLHLRYTARDCGDEIANNFALPGRTAGMFLSVRHDLPDAWQAFAQGEALALDVRRDRFPTWATRDAKLAISSITVGFLLREGGSLAALTGTVGGAPLTLQTLDTPDPRWVPYLANASLPAPGTWAVALSGAIDLEAIDDVIVIVGYGT